MKNEVKRGIILAGAIILVVVLIKLLQNTDNTVKDLKKKGYSDSDITILTNNLSEEEVKNLVKSEFKACLPKILSNKYYIKDNLQKYLDNCKNNDDVDEVISIVNVGAYNEWYTFTKEVTNLSNSMLVNKFNYLPAEYSPDDIVKVKNWYAYEGHSIKDEVYEQFIDMFEAARLENLKFLINTSYITFEEQERIYKNSSNEYSAKPGFSEYQTGLSLGIVKDGVSMSKFDETDEFRWLQDNAHKFGFILRYPKGKEKITGFTYQPWHYRYLGTALATKVYESGLSYDEYYAYYCEYKKEC